MRLEGAPPCMLPGCNNRVQFNYDTAKARQGWRKYCSRRCSGLANKVDGRLARGRMLRHVRMHAATIRAAVGDQWKSGDPVTLQQLSTLAKLAYKRGWQSRNMRDEHDARQRLKASFGRNVLPPKPKLTTESWWIGLSRRAFQKAVKDRFPES